MSTERLTPTSYLVLGLLAREGPSTPYDLEQHVRATLGNFWSFPHTLLYSEPPRLAALGLAPLAFLAAGIGFAIARRLLADGASVLIHAWPAPEQGVLDELATIGPPLECLEADFGDPEAPRRVIEHAAGAQPYVDGPEVLPVTIAVAWLKVVEARDGPHLLLRFDA